MNPGRKMGLQPGSGSLPGPTPAMLGSENTGSFDSELGGGPRCPEQPSLMSVRTYLLEPHRPG